MSIYIVYICIYICIHIRIYTHRDLFLILVKKNLRIKIFFSLNKNNILITRFLNYILNIKFNVSNSKYAEQYFFFFFKFKYVTRFNPHNITSPRIS